MTAKDVRVNSKDTEHANRYKWLREHGGNTFSWDEWRNLADLSAEELDAAIDKRRFPKRATDVSQR